MRSLSVLTAALLLVSAGFAEPLRFDSMVKATERMQIGPARLLKLKLPVATRPQRNGDGPATRSEMVAELRQMFLNFRPVLRGRPTTIPFRNYAIERCNLPEASRDHAFELLDWGFVAPVGPLMVSGGDTLTPEEYGDCLGFFLCRLADLTHPWSAEFSPDTMPN
ncbi:MAG: hypothetical protein KF812_03985 [Fimbriimonadaceae bacterium]|nr:hypothetical protein [Fimbriimonadaceae bacterium]